MRLHVNPLLVAPPPQKAQDMAVANLSHLHTDAKALTKLLGRRGLPTDFNEAIAQLARTIRDHEHFERILSGIDPAERHDFYEAVAPHLRFKAKPLDVYVSDAGQRAERDQLPTMGPDGAVREFRPGCDVATLNRAAEDAIAKALAERTLTLTCKRCPRQESFPAIGRETKVDAILKARKAGWVYHFKAKVPYETCPDCSTGDIDAR